MWQGGEWSQKNLLTLFFINTQSSSAIHASGKTGVACSIYPFVDLVVKLSLIINKWNFTWICDRFGLVLSQSIKADDLFHYWEILSQDYSFSWKSTLEVSQEKWCSVVGVIKNICCTPQWMECQHFGRVVES